MACRSRRFHRRLVTSRIADTAPAWRRRVEEVDARTLGNELTAIAPSPSPTTHSLLPLRLRCAASCGSRCSLNAFRVAVLSVDLRAESAAASMHQRRARHPTNHVPNSSVWHCSFGTHRCTRCTSSRQIFSPSATLREAPGFLFKNP